MSLGLLTMEQAICIDQCGHSFPRLSDFEVRDLEGLIEWDLSDPEIQDLHLDGKSLEEGQGR